MHVWYIFLKIEKQIKLGLCTWQVWVERIFCWFQRRIPGTYWLCIPFEISMILGLKIVQTKSESVHSIGYDFWFYIRANCLLDMLPDMTFELYIGVCLFYRIWLLNFTSNSTEYLVWLKYLLRELNSSRIFNLSLLVPSKNGQDLFGPSFFLMWSI